MEFVKAQEENLPEIRELYAHLLDSRPELGMILRWKKDIYPTDTDFLRYIRMGAMYIAIEDGKTVGAVAVTPFQPEEYHAVPWGRELRDDEAAVIHILAVSPEYQGRGVASRMVDCAVETAESLGKKAVRLDAITTNIPAQKLYEKHGFRKCGVLKAWYESTGWAEFYGYEYLL